MKHETERVNGLTFGQWKAEVDQEVLRVAGIGCDDLPDTCYWDMWYDEMSPEEMAGELLEDCGFPRDDE